MSEDSKVISIGKSEADKAAELKKRAAELLEPFCRLRDEAMREGLLIGFGGVAVGPSGRNEVVDLHVMKRF